MYIYTKNKLYIYIYIYTKNYEIKVCFIGFYSKKKILLAQQNFFDKTENNYLYDK